MINNFSDTVCAPATSVGTGAVSMIRISGPESLAAVDRVVRFRSGTASSSRGYVLKYGEIPGVDEVVAAIYRAPHSYTGEDSAELCCHASAFIVSRILELLCENGCRLAEAGEFTRRAFVNGKMDLAQAEAVADVIASSSEAQHRVAMNQLRGGYSAELGKIRAELLRLATLVELELDFSEEDVEFADRSQLATLLDEATERCTALASSFRVGNAIRNGVPVAIVGAPNSGKSTLLNALLHDERAIVSDVPGTTRDTVEETCVIGGVLFRFIDTAGIRDTDDEVERLGIERSFNKAAQAEVVLGVVDASGLADAGATDCPSAPSGPADGSSSPETAGDDMTVFGQIRKLAEIADTTRQKLVILMNKSDMLGLGGNAAPTAGGREDIQGEFPANKNVLVINNFVKCAANKSFTADILWISAKQGRGLAELRRLLASTVGTLASDAVLVTNARHAAALSDAASSLRAARSGLDTLPTDLLAEDLRSALASLGTITGEITTDEVLGEVFRGFCIGK